MAVVVLLGCVVVAYWAGRRAQRYRQARDDVRDAWGKLRKARTARRPLRLAAVNGWLMFGAAVGLAAWLFAVLKG